MKKMRLLTYGARKRKDHYVGYVMVGTSPGKKNLYTVYSGIKRIIKADAIDDALKLAECL